MGMNVHNLLYSAARQRTAPRAADSALPLSAACPGVGVRQVRHRAPSICMPSLSSETCTTVP